MRPLLFLTLACAVLIYDIAVMAFDDIHFEQFKNKNVCPKCDHHLRIGARTRFNIFFDNGNLSEVFLGTDYPISRALEIEINQNQSSIVWQHSLPENLFGFASGNAQKLDNGNYLITTVGGNGNSIEVSSDGEEVWRGNYNLCEPI